VEAGHRDIQDALTAIICHGALRRFPGVRLAAVENGAAWVPGLLANLDHAYRNMPQEFPEHPAETFRRHVWVHPFHEEDPRELVGLVGADHVIFGSDFPHVEGLAEPLSFLDEISDLPDEHVRQIMGGNMLGLLGVAA
jgi:predicted TIM-barrel fold metal-dependent hydrolase